MDTLFAHTSETSRIADLDTFGDVRSKPKKWYVVFVVAALSRMCEARSGTQGGGRTARSMMCIRSEAMPRTLDRRAPELRRTDIGQLVEY